MGYQKLSRLIQTSTLTLTIVLLLAGCGAETDDRGLCSLSCSDAKALGTSDGFSLINVVDSVGGGVTAIEDNVQCPAAAAGILSFPVTYTFRATKPMSEVTFPQSGDNTDEVVTEDIVGRTTRTTEAGGAKVSVSTSGFGWATEDKYNAVGSYDATNDIFEPAETAGIATPVEEWCTDSCGMFRVQLYLTCPAPGTNTEAFFTVSSGSAHSIRTKINLSTEEAGDQNLTSFDEINSLDFSLLPQ